MTGRAGGGVGSSFSAQPRADGDEAGPRRRRELVAVLVSVLNREPMGMKHCWLCCREVVPWSFSAQPRADGDEATELCTQLGLPVEFQCSTASRWG